MTSPQGTETDFAQRREFLLPLECHKVHREKRVTADSFHPSQSLGLRPAELHNTT